MRLKPPLSWKFFLTLALTVSTVALALVHVWLFHDPDTFFFYIALDFVFLPVQVLLVSVLIDHLLKDRERRAKLAKMNMVIGAFFSEAGTGLMRKLRRLCPHQDELAAHLAVTVRWEKADYHRALGLALKDARGLAYDPEVMQDIKVFLCEKRAFIMGLLQNPNLLEHERFTDLLWAVCHFTEELGFRESLTGLPKADIEHLLGDARRAFDALIREWMHYLVHLKHNYPFVHSLAVRANPLARVESVVFQDKPAQSG